VAFTKVEKYTSNQIKQNDEHFSRFLLPASEGNRLPLS